MSYMALARKWRPRMFSDVMGQDHVVRALSHALRDDKLHPAILLTGTRGVGKTTLARIVAKGLNCETGVSADPCGTCSACNEVDGGRFVDLLEIDAASNTGVDNVRELIDNSQYSPARGRYKVYLIDEVHMLSKSAFNALLKTLEEPPPHVKFILATTDPQKLPITVLSRCLQFNLKRLPSSVIRDQLLQILQQESIESEPAAINEISRAADGSMRDGLSLLDQAIAFAGGHAIARTAVEDMLGTSGRQVLYELLKAVAASDAGALHAGIEQLESRAPDYFAALNDLSASLQRIAVLQAVPAAANDDDDEGLKELVDSFAAEDVQLCYQIAVSGRRDLPWAPDPKSGFEMTLLRMVLFRPDEGGAGQAGGGGPKGAGTGAVRSSPSRVASAQATRKSTASTPVSEFSAPEQKQSALESAPVGEISNPATESNDAENRKLPWATRIDTLNLDGPARQLARQCAWGDMSTSGEVRLVLAEAADYLLREPVRLSLESALSRQEGKPIKLKIDVDRTVEADSTEAASQTPAQIELSQAEQDRRDLEERMDRDPVVQAFREQFGARIRPGSIHPNA